MHVNMDGVEISLGIDELRHFRIEDEKQLRNFLEVVLQKKEIQIGFRATPPVEKKKEEVKSENRRPDNSVQ